MPHQTRYNIGNYSNTEANNFADSLQIRLFIRISPFMKIMQNWYSKRTEIPYAISYQYAIILYGYTELSSHNMGLKSVTGLQKTKGVYNCIPGHRSCFCKYIHSKKYLNHRGQKSTLSPDEKT